MTEQNGHEEHERNSARDGDAGFAALDATESYFGSTPQGNTETKQPVAPPVEEGGYEAHNKEPPSAGRCLLLLLKNPHTLTSLPTRTNLRIRQSLCTLKQSTLKQSTRGSIGLPRTKWHPQKR